MKKIQNWIATITFGLVFFLAPNVLSAQQNVLKFKPFSFEFAYERSLSPLVSLQLAGRFLPIGVTVESSEGDGGSSYYNYRLTPEARFYVARRGSLTGFFIAPHLKLGYNTFKGETESDTDLRAEAKFTGTSIGGGLTLGWQWVMGKGFTIDTQFGWGYTHLRFSDVDVTYADGRTETEQADLDGLKLTLPRVGFSIGYAF